MNLYLISQHENNGYDTFDSAVVCAENEEAAKLIHPYKHLWESSVPPLILDRVPV